MGRFRGRIFLLRRKTITAVAVCLAVVAIFYVINNPAIVGTAATERALPIYSVQRDYKVVSLTFNATEPEDQYTADVVQMLNYYGVQATFFVTGEWVRANDTLAREMVESGHEVMNLSDDHSFFKQLSTSEILANVTACNDAIEAATGVRPSMFRVPYGEYDDNVVNTLSAMGMHTIQWSVDSGDWRGLDADGITKRVTDRAFAGSIVLLHSDMEQTAEAVSGIIEGLLREGFVLAPLSEVVIQSEYTISPSGKQIPA